MEDQPAEKLTIEQVRERLRALCERAGSMRAWGEQHGLSGAFVADVLKGARDPGRRMLGALGLERTVNRTVTYRDAGTSGIARAMPMTGARMKEGRDV